MERIVPRAAGSGEDHAKDEAAELTAGFYKITMLEERKPGGATIEKFLETLNEVIEEDGGINPNRMFRRLEDAADLIGYHVLMVGGEVTLRPAGLGRSERFVGVEGIE